MNSNESFDAQLNDPSDIPNGHSKKFSQDLPNIFTSPRNSISIYTVLSILLRMKDQLGLEAMLEYVQNYLKIINDHNPELKPAVERALNLMSVEKIYKDAMKCKEGEQR